MNFYDVDEHLKVVEPLELLSFIFLNEYYFSTDFIVCSDMDEFLKLVDLNATVFCIDSTNEWIQRLEGLNIVLRNIDSYFEFKKAIPLSYRMNSIG